MRFIIVLLFVLLPGFLSAKTYRYDRVILSVKGSDYFALDNNTETKDGGYVILNSYKLHIDNKTYILRKCKKDRMYKAKGLLFKFTYKNDGLAILEVYGYDKVYTYYLHTV